MSGPTPARRVRDALEPVAALSFWSEPSAAAYAALGLTDFAPAYVASRSSALGAADASVVAAAFGVFAPELVASNLAVARRACSTDDVRDATLSGAADAARRVLVDVEDREVDEVVDALWRGVGAVDDTARVLFAGTRALGRPDDRHAALWRGATAWRELRGDSHLAACVSHGLSGLQANLLTELAVGYPLGEYTATRGWSAEQIGGAADALRERGLVASGALSDAGRSLRSEVERVTDDAVEPAVSALGPDLDHVVRRCADWSQRILDRGWFPDDERKRAAG